jgi:CheY-like chemotaxis protein
VIRILFLDDDHRRIDTIRARLESLPCDLTVVETADECIAQLAGGTFDLVLLDHDLGGEIYCDSSREDCGMEVVRWLKKHRGSHGGFIVHTMNPIAAAAMYFDLDAMGYNVVQATFGSSEFFRHLHAMIGIDLPESKQRESLSDRITKYFRSLRSGR